MNDWQKSSFWLYFNLFVSFFIYLFFFYFHLATSFLCPDDGALRVWKNFADQKNPEMVTAWQGLSDMLPTTRGQPSSSTHSKDQHFLLLRVVLMPHSPAVLLDAHPDPSCPTRPSHKFTPPHPQQVWHKGCCINSNKLKHWIYAVLVLCAHFLSSITSCLVPLNATEDLISVKN